GFTNTVVTTFNFSSGYGSVVTDPTGDVSLTKDFDNAVIKVDSGGTASTFATIGSSTSLALALTGSTLFAGNSAGELYSMNTGGPTPSLIASGLGSINGMAIAHGSFGSLGGQLLVASTSGILAVDIGGAFGVTTLVGSGTYSDLAFTNDGRLIATRYGSAINEIDASGTVTTQISSVAVDALTVHASTGDIFAGVSSGGGGYSKGDILRIDSTTFSQSLFASGVGFDAGYFPSGLEFSSDGGSLYYYEGTDSSAILARIDGFSTGTAIPEPASLALFGFGLAGLTYARRRRSGATA
ncbi:MAG: PEP-CTERM sorting domain-containing protein, partial [Alphaproteobacteria bacterium]